MSQPYVKKTEVAGSVPFDNSDNNFTSDDVQAAIEELANRVANPKIITHFRNASGYEIETFNRMPGTHIESAPLVVCDRHGNVVTGLY